ncbi:MAG: CvpA family protein [Anaerolineales bacterium]|nr:CvpA family protein [Anaerolineales bacterium]
MMPLTTVFGLLIILFGILGGFRGWAKEIMVVSSMILALFFIYLLQTFVPDLFGILDMSDSQSQFLLRAVIILLLAFFGYETPRLTATLAPKLRREKLQDWLLGFILGMVNGYLIFGSIWYYLHLAGYPWPEYVQAPLAGSVDTLIDFLPPKVIGEPPIILFAIAIAFVFVIVVLL